MAYVRVSSKTLQEIINTKAYYIARKALWFTKKADAPKIREELGEVKGTALVRLKSGKWSHSKKNVQSFFTRGGARAEAPLLALIIQKQSKKSGQGSPWKGRSRAAGAAAMLEAMRRKLNARVQSIAFLRAGWLPGIRTLAPLADKGGSLPPIDARQRGQPKGYAKPAGAGFNPVAEIVNKATTYRDQKGALIKYGGPALQQAFDDEALDMQVYIERKMKEDAAVFNAKQR